MIRGFEKISFEQFKKDILDNIKSYNELKLPERKTKTSAGYDFYLPYDITIKPNEIITIPTGIKVKLQNNEFLGIYIRSSIGFKYNIRMCNQVGIIDADYYNNQDNEGHIYIKIQNHGDTTITFKQNERIAQGIFQTYLITSDDITTNERVGGLGSTSKKGEN